MKLLVGKTHDPATQVTFALTNRVMTALDTTNLRLTFVAPESGRVMVRLVVPLLRANSTAPIMFLGVLEGATVRGRVMASQNNMYSAGNMHIAAADAFFTVTGLTPGQSYTWDAAAGVYRMGNTTDTLGWGGPADATQNNARGGCQFTVWDPGPSLLAALTYDPAFADPAVYNRVSLMSGKAMTALDTTNLRHTFTAPSSGRVMVRIGAALTELYGSPVPGVFLGVLEGTTVRRRVISTGSGDWYTYSGSTAWFTSVAFPITDLTPGQSYTWDAAYGVERSHWGGYIGWGGSNTTGMNVGGALLYEIWEA